jgi:hypothetical protein
MTELQSDASCKICTIHLEELCFKRVWWFRSFCSVLGAGVRMFAFAKSVRTDSFKSRSPMCRKCIRFHKNILKTKSPLFNWIDGLFTPVFDSMRNGILTQEEVDRARMLARRAAERDFERPVDLVTL